jgi:hypothetical protein
MQSIIGNPQLIKLKYSDTSCLGQLKLLHLFWSSNSLLKSTLQEVPELL